MKIFLDTANAEEIRKGMSMGLVDGVTTNPTLIAREKKPFDSVVREILAMVPGPVSLEAVSTEREAIVQEGRKLAALAKNVVVKIPVTTEGLAATKQLAQEGIRVNTTLVFTPIQALLAAKAGASYVSPFVGRLDDIGEDGMRVVEDTRKAFQNYGYKTEIIVASVRNPMHVYRAAIIGADVVTMPYQVLEKLISHPKTKEGLQLFAEDWQKVQSLSQSGMSQGRPQFLESRDGVSVGKYGRSHHCYVCSRFLNLKQVVLLYPTVHGYAVAKRQMIPDAPQCPHLFQHGRYHRLPPEAWLNRHHEDGVHVRQDVSDGGLSGSRIQRYPDLPAPLPSLVDGLERGSFCFRMKVNREVPS